MFQQRNHSVSFGFAFLLLGCCLLINLSVGSVTIPLEAIGRCLLGQILEKPSWQQIILDYRVPKAMTAMLVGAGLGSAGLLMQTLFRNPLAGPFVLGISSGASLGVAIMVLGGTSLGLMATVVVSRGWGLIAGASLGSAVILFITLAAGSILRDTMSFLVLGLMFGSLSGAVVSVLSFTATAESLQHFVFWGFGHIGNLSWPRLQVFASVVLFGFVIATTQIKVLNAMLLSESYVQSMGGNLQRTKFLLLLGTSLLAGSVTAFAGPIAFIGLAVPHFVRQVFDTRNHAILLPAVVFFGASLMLLCDSVAQLPGRPEVLPINAITALVGAPVVIWLLLYKRKIRF